MKYAVRRSVCWLCQESYSPSWIVSDTSGRVSYVSRTWRKAFDYAYAAAQPGTGDQVRQLVSQKVSSA